MFHLLEGQREEVFDPLDEGLVHECVHLLVHVALIRLGGKRLHAQDGVGGLGGHRLCVLLLVHPIFLQTL